MVILAETATLNPLSQESQPIPVSGAKQICPHGACLHNRTPRKVNSVGHKDLPIATTLRLISELLVSAVLALPAAVQVNLDNTRVMAEYNAKQLALSGQCFKQPASYLTRRQSTYRTPANIHIHEVHFTTSKYKLQHKLIYYQDLCAESLPL